MSPFLIALGLEVSVYIKVHKKLAFLKKHKSKSIFFPMLLAGVRLSASCFAQICLQRTAVIYDEKEGQKGLSLLV